LLCHAGHHEKLECPVLQLSVVQFQNSAAGLLNALEIQGKTPENAMLTCLGAGAAGIATLDLLCELGFQKSNILLVDYFTMSLETKLADATPTNTSQSCTASAKVCLLVVLT
jgi:malic enzyme